MTNQYYLRIGVLQISHLYLMKLVLWGIQIAPLPYLMPVQESRPFSLSRTVVLEILFISQTIASQKDEVKRWEYITQSRCEAGSAQLSLMLCVLAHHLPHLRVGMHMHQ